MRMVMMMCGLVFWAFPSFAQDWQPMNGDQISETLNDTRVTYANGYQIFHTDGRTLYAVGNENWGSWRVEGDQYCSQWPPSNYWDCYDMTQDSTGQRVRFISPAGRIFEGALSE